MKKNEEQNKEDEIDIPDNVEIDIPDNVVEWIFYQLAKHEK